MSSDSDHPYDTRRPAKQLNFNSILLTLVLAISAWSLREIVQQGRDFSKMEERLAGQTVAVTELRVRLTATETSIVALQVKIAELQVRARP